MSSTNVSSLEIRLIDDISPGAKAMAEALKRAEAQAKELDEALARAAGSDKFKAKLKAMGASVSQVDGITVAFERLAKAEGFALEKGTKLSAEQAKALKNLENLSISTTRAQLGADRALMTERVRNREREAQAADRSFRDAERSAMRQRQVEHRLMEQRQHEMKRMGFGHYAAGTLAAGVSAHGMMSLGERAAEKGAELQDTRLSLRNAGIGKAIAEEIEKHSLEVSRRFANVSQIAVMDLAKEARSVLQNPEEVGPITTILAQAKSVLDAADKTGNSSAGLGMLVRGAESIGAGSDPARFAKLMDGYVKAMQVMGKTINPEQIYEFDKYLKTAGARVSDRLLMTTGLSLSQELGGSTAANGIFHAQKDIIGGFQNKHTPLREMVRVGLIDRGDVEFSKAGEAKGIKAGHQGIHHADLAAEDLDLFVYNVLLPAIEKKGMRKETDQLNWVQKVFTGEAGNVISKLITQRASFENHAKLYGGAAGLSAAKSNPESATAGLTAFNTALNNLMSNVTVEAMAPVGRGLYLVADGLNYLAQRAKDHPMAALGIGGATAAGGLAGAGWLGWKMLSGFGRAGTTMATAGATQLRAAEMMLAAAGGKVPGGIPCAPGEAPAGSFDKGRALVAGLGLAGVVANSPGMDAGGDRERQANASSLDRLGNMLGYGYVDAARQKLQGWWAGTGATSPHDEMGREAERGRALMQISPPLEKLKDDFGLTGFVLGQLNDAAARASTSLASLASFGGGGGSGGGGGIINASWDGSGGFGGGSGGSGGGGAGSGSGGSGGRDAGWSPSASDPSFSAARDASGLNWSKMGVQMGAKAAYLGDHLRGIGMSELGAAAMLGHASVESNFKVDAYNGRKENSHGLFQWNDGVGRWSGLKRWAAANGRNPNDPLAQIDYAKVESMRMRGPHGQSVWDSMNHAGSLAEANRIWMDRFEAPKVRDYGNRLAAGQRALGAMRSVGGKVQAAPRRPHVVPTSHDTMAGLTPAVDLQHLHRAAQLTREIKGNLADIGTMSAPHTRGYKPGSVRRAMDMQFAGAAGRMG